jgi:protein-tyrosine phosphatase
MIDLHTHILPGVDDGAPDLATALDMARMAVDDGIKVMACTPHFMPGIYDNESSDIRCRIADFTQRLRDANIPLEIVVGADAHMRPDFLSCLHDGKILRLNDSRYVLFEPPHNIAPKRLEDLLFNIVASGYVPILTHPERLNWIENQFTVFEDLTRIGVWMQVTAGSLTGRFGGRPKYWAEKMLAKGMVHILATDAHNLKSRPPLLTEAFAKAQSEVGLDEANNLTLIRPVNVLDDLPVADQPPLLMNELEVTAAPSGWRRLFRSNQ